MYCSSIWDCISDKTIQIFKPIYIKVVMLYGLILLGAVCFCGYMWTALQRMIPIHYAIPMFLLEIPTNTFIFFHPIASGKAKF